MSVELTPSHQLGFHKPLTQLVKRSLTISNPGKNPVAFKVKTTAPKQYCVRPNSGRVEPGERVEVQVLLQPMREDPPNDAKCRDKFLVQSAAITADKESLGLPEIWAALEADAKADKASSQIHEQKIRCAYLPPLEGADADANHPPSYEGSALLANGSSEEYTNSSPQANGVRNSTYETPQRDSAISDTAYGTPRDSTTSNVKPMSTIASEAGDKSVGETAGEAKNTLSAQAAAAGAAIAGTASAGVAALSNAMPASLSKPTNSTEIGSSSDSSLVDSLRKQLASALAEVDNLKVQVKDSTGLRQRTNGAAAKGQDASAQLAASLKSAQAQGYPLEMVAAIAFGVFLFTWLFL